MDASVLFGFLYSQFFTTPKYPEESCKGKTFIVTGANVGLGKEAARHFVRLGAAKVILACRNQEKGEAAKKDIEESEKSSSVVDVWSLDLSSYESVKEFAKQVEGLNRIDAIVENAGIATDKFSISEDNESTITTNVVSTFLLAFLVLPSLRRSAQQHNIQPRLTIVSSEVHSFTSFPERNAPSIFETLNSPTEARMDDRYPVSKLLEVFTIREMSQQKPQPSSVIINMVNPGLCVSELSRDSKGWGMWLMMRVLARTTEVGSRNLVAGAFAGPESHGEYMSDCTITPTSKLVRSEEGKDVQKKVWSELSAKLERIQPGILENL